MNSLVLVLNDEDEWSPEEWLVERGGKRGVGRQVVLEEKAAEWLSVSREDDILQDYDDLEREKLSTVLLKPVLFLVEWKGHNLVEQLLRSVPKESGAMVDNDHGVIASIELVRALPIDAWARCKRLP